MTWQADIVVRDRFLDMERLELPRFMRGGLAAGPPPSAAPLAGGGGDICASRAGTALLLAGLLLT
jgi:hypothetical protein